LQDISLSGIYLAWWQ